MFGQHLYDREEMQGKIEGLNDLVMKVLHENTYLNQRINLLEARVSEEGCCEDNACSDESEALAHIETVICKLIDIADYWDMPVDVRYALKDSIKRLNESLEILD